MQQRKENSFFSLIFNIDICSTHSVHESLFKVVYFVKYCASLKGRDVSMKPPVTISIRTDENVERKKNEN